MLEGGWDDLDGDKQRTNRLLKNGRQLIKLGISQWCGYTLSLVLLLLQTGHGNHGPGLA